MSQKETMNIASPAQIQALSEYIACGISHGCGDCIGLELEHFIVNRADQTLIPYFDDSVTGRPGVGSVLQRLAPFYDSIAFESQDDGEQYPIGLSRKYANITLEPGAQFEISIGPVLEIRDLDIVYRAFRAELDPILAELDYELLTVGYHPTSQAQDIPLIPKSRYRFMNEHFKKTGKHGICMMRATASTQVSIDYDSESDAILKFRIANALTPLLAFITDNSPYFETAKVGVRGNPNEKATSGLAVPWRMARTLIWNDVDADRSMTAPGSFDEDFGFATYAEKILGAPAIFSLNNKTGTNQPDSYQDDRSFADVFADVEFDREIIEHILSLFFFDVRFKTYIEIRAADSLPIDLALAFAALLKAVFYNPAAITTLAEQFNQVSAQSIAEAKAALVVEGYLANIYGRPMTFWVDELFELARGSLSESEAAYLEPLSQLVAQRRTLIDDL